MYRKVLKVMLEWTDKINGKEVPMLVVGVFELKADNYGIFHADRNALHITNIDMHYTIDEERIKRTCVRKYNDKLIKGIWLNEPRDKRPIKDIQFINNLKF